MNSWASRLPPLVMIGLAIAFILGARDFKPASASIPVLIGWTVLVLAVIDLASQFDWRPGAALRKIFTAQSQSVPGHAVPVVEPRRQVMAVAGLLGLVVGFFAIGILPMSAAFVALALRFGANVTWPRSVIGALTVTLLLWLAFGMLLGLHLPLGFIFEGGTD